MDKKELCQLARQARQQAYCPYSNYKVGAAVLGENGKVYLGCNIENASYGLTVCAERCAIFKMVSDGCLHFTALAVASSGTKDGAPCLACRQVMTEFTKDFQVPVYHYGGDDSIFEHTMEEICPLPFVSFVPGID